MGGPNSNFGFLMNSQRRFFPTIAGRNLSDPGNWFVAPKKPPAVAPPPQGPDATDAYLREVSRAETDAELGGARRRSMFGATYRGGR